MLVAPTLFLLSLFCFFQAEDGIRYYKVTGVQTCALPISVSRRNHPARIQVCGEPSGVGVQSQAIKPPAFLIRFTAVEDRAFELPMMSENAGGEDAEIGTSVV